VLCDALCFSCSEGFDMACERSVRALFNIAGCSAPRRLEVIAEGGLTWSLGALEKFDRGGHLQLHHCVTELCERVDAKGVYCKRYHTLKGRIREAEALQARLQDELAHTEEQVVSAESRLASLPAEQQPERERLQASEAEAKQRREAALKEVATCETLENDAQAEVSVLQDALNAALAREEQAAADMKKAVEDLPAARICFDGKILRITTEEKLLDCEADRVEEALRCASVGVDVYHAPMAAAMALEQDFAKSLYAKQVVK